MRSCDQQVWIDVLLSAGVQVEVCRVKAKEGSVAQVKRKRSIPVKRRCRGEGVKGEVESGEGGEEEEAEDGLESGEEGLGEGYWEKEGKRVKVN